MTDGEALLRAVLAAPAEDTPRLVYADWFEEHDQPEFAEFMRIQCELARMPEGDPCRPPLSLREQELLKWHAYQFLQLDHPQVVRGMTFSRGLVEQVQIPALQLLKDTSLLCRLPTLRSAVLDDVMADHLSVLASLAWPDRLAVLELRAWWEQDTSPDWASTPREVERIRVAEAESLSALARFEQLQSFCLANFVIDDDARQKLLDSFGDRLRLVQMR